MPTAPAGSVSQIELKNKIKKVTRKFRKEMVRVNYSLREDSTGDPSIFFRIVLTDAASREDRLGDVATRIGAALFDELRPYENWGLNSYFNFRSKSEQDARNDPEWA